MEKICLDTDVVIDFLRGEKTIVDKIRYYTAKEELCITPNTMLYLLIGVRKIETIKPFLHSISVLEFDKNAATTAAKIIGDNRERGKAMGFDEVMTAAVCLSRGALLFTRGRADYEHVKGLKLV